MSRGNGNRKRRNQMERPLKKCEPYTCPKCRRRVNRKPCDWCRITGSIAMHKLGKALREAAAVVKEQRDLPAIASPSKEEIEAACQQIPKRRERKVASEPYTIPLVPFVAHGVERERA